MASDSIAARPGYTPTRTSDDYEQLCCIRPDGATRTISRFKHRDPPRATMSLAAAIDGLDAGQMVWVAPADAPAVRDWLAARRGR